MRRSPLHGLRSGRARWRGASLVALACCASAASSAPIVLDGATAHHSFDGIGALSAGASSRLLFDYAEPHRSDILDLLFLPSTGASLQMLKVEIGGDAQSTDGAEASHMHTRSDLSCSRGYEGWLIAEAKARNPAILTYGLSWAVPHWVGDGAGNGTGFHSADNYLYQTQWLQCIKATTGATIDYLGTWNEKPPGPPGYVTGLRAALDAAGFGTTQLSIYDGDYSTQNIIIDALADPAFNASFAAVGRHYACDYPFPTIESAIHKRYWSAEDASTANDWSGASCWGRLLSQNYVLMNMTATIAWSLIWSAPLGLPCDGAGLLTAQQPWSGHYSGGDGAGGASATPSLDGPLWTTAHTTQFTAPGWRYLHVPGGGSGLLPPAAGNGSYVTLVPRDSLAHFTLVIEKASPQRACKCKPANVSGDTADALLTFQTRGGLPGGGATLQLWRSDETRQFWRDADVAIAADGSFSVHVPRDSFATLSTLPGAAHGGVAPSSIPAPASFPLPYADAFASYAEDATPVRFWADQTGSWAARGGALRQVVTADPGPNRWAVEDVDPLTLVGDASLGAVQAAVTATFAPARNASGPGVATGGFGFTYVQLCVRVTNYTGFRNGAPPGLCLAVNATGAWLARAGAAAAVLGSGQLPPGFDAAQPHTLVLRAAGQGVAGWVVEGGGGSSPPPGVAPLLNTSSATFAAGMVGLGSGYHDAAFFNFSLSAAA